MCDKVKELEEKLIEKEKAVQDLKEEIKDLRNDMIKENNQNSQVEKEMKDLLHQVRKGIQSEVKLNMMNLTLLKVQKER